MGERVIAVPKLPSLDAAVLFCRRASRKLRVSELWGDIPTHRRHGEAYHALANNPVLIKLDGHPGAICTIATTQLQSKRHDFV